MTIFDRPVFILGAPRSGTSLLQKLIREHPEFVSVARESEIIWNKYCHPRLNDWEGEGCPNERINEDVVREIQKQFAGQLLSANFWQGFDRLGLMRNPRTAGILRKIYRPLYKFQAIVKDRLPQREKSVRLVDKSVHAGFWINLIEAAFPEARYIHIVRDGQSAVDSMLDGWLDPNRFQTYYISEAQNIGEYKGEAWCFPLPPKWRELVNLPLEMVVARQWMAIQKTILDDLDRFVPVQRRLRVKLEDLAENPDHHLRRIASFIEVSNESYFFQYMERLPKINARPDGRSGIRHPEAISRIVPIISKVQDRLDYSDGGKPE